MNIEKPWDVIIEKNKAILAGAVCTYQNRF